MLIFQEASFDKEKAKKSLFTQFSKKFAKDKTTEKNIEFDLNHKYGDIDAIVRGKGGETYYKYNPSTDKWKCLGFTED